MLIFFIIVSCLLWIASIAALPKRVILAPALSFCALLLISFARNAEGYPVIPLSQGMIISWLATTLIVMLVVILQDPGVRQQSRGVGYMILGGLAGMAVGLLAFSFTATLQLLFACMLLGSVIGIFLGLLIFVNTPDGRAIAPGSGHFFTYLLAKGFPTLVTVAQIGVAAVIAIAAYLHS